MNKLTRKHDSKLASFSEKVVVDEKVIDSKKSTYYLWTHDEIEEIARNCQFNILRKIEGKPGNSKSSSLILNVAI